MRLRGKRNARPFHGLGLVGVALVVATYASGGWAAPGPSVPGVTSGSRIRARFWDGGGGALLFRGWFDSELRIPCVFRRTRNGQMRCLPAGQPAIFADSTCTAPVWGTPSTPVWNSTRPSAYLCPEASPTYVSAIVGWGVAAAYALGEPYGGAVHYTSEGTCLVDNFASPGSNAYYRTGAEIPSDRFVAATISTGPVDNGTLERSTTRADDGFSEVVVGGQRLERAWRAGTLPPQMFEYVGSGRLRVPTYVDAHGEVMHVELGDFLDTETHVPCHPEPFADGLRCLPRTVVELSQSGPYLDAACTVRLSETKPRSELPPPDAGALAVATDCSEWTAYTLGDVVTPAVVYAKGSTCQPKSPLPGAVYRSTTPTGDSQWAPVTEGVQ